MPRQCQCQAPPGAAQRTAASLPWLRPLLSAPTFTHPPPCCSVPHAPDGVHACLPDPQPTSSDERVQLAQQAQALLELTLNPDAPAPPAEPAPAVDRSHSCDTNGSATGAHSLTALAHAAEAFAAESPPDPPALTAIHSRLPLVCLAPQLPPRHRAAVNVRALDGAAPAADPPR